MEQARIDQLDLVRVEMRRRAAERREVEVAASSSSAGDRLDRLRRADPRQHVEQRHRLDPFLAQMLGAVGAEPLRQLALGGDEQRLVRELRRLGAERLEHLDLRGAVRHMVLAANDVGDAEVDVVDHARQQIEPAAVLAANDGIAEQLRVEASARRG